MIYVFKTTVKTEIHIQKLKPHIDSTLPNAKWNFDLEDCDKILRIDSQNCSVDKIAEILKEQGFECSELE